VKRKTNEYSNVDISSRLKLIRAEKGYTQAQMAKRIGISEGGYVKYESGERSPSLSVQLYLVKELGLSLNWLLFNIGPKYLNTAETHRLELDNALENQRKELTIKHREEMTTKHREELQTLTQKFQLQPELKELTDAMKRDEVLYYEILASFKRYQRNNLISE
jgi:transcriptional regulator with XRE-family HTH domain